MKSMLAGILCLLCLAGKAQYSRDDIYSGFVLYNKRVLFEQDVRENIIAKTFAQPLDSNTEYKYEAACRAVSQFLPGQAAVAPGFEKLFAQYDSLQYETQHAFLEAVYSVTPAVYGSRMRTIFEKETQPKLFCICAAYLFRNDASVDNVNSLKIRLVEQFPGYDTVEILLALERYLDTQGKNRRLPAPAMANLFRYQRKTGQKIIYSFQRWNRDYAGLAIVQNSDGRFMRHPDGRLIVFEQLARSGADLPYFITNGSTPQGIYSVQGTGISHNNLIGPTPNLQLLLPFENSWENFFLYPQGMPWDSTRDVLPVYLDLLPPSWRNYAPMLESFYAGKIGRNEIIAHGTTIDPQYFKDKPFYPLTPTNGCLCAKELWNVTSGRLLVSEQLNLISAFTATPGNKGYLMVINVDDQQKPVSRVEVEKWVREAER